MRVISGASKGYGWRATNSAPRLPADHAWNMARIDGQWQLFDVTWAAGHLDDANRFQAKLDDFWFFTPPAQFIFSHLPEIPDHQLLDTAWSAIAFAAAPKVTPAYFRRGLGVRFPSTGYVASQGDLDLGVACPQGAFLMTSLKPARAEGRGREATTSDRSDETGHYHFSWRELPPGESTLLVQVSTELFGTFQSAIEYTVAVG